MCGSEESSACLAEPQADDSNDSQSQISNAPELCFGCEIPLKAAVSELSPSSSSVNDGSANGTGAGVDADDQQLLKPGYGLGPAPAAEPPPAACDQSSDPVRAWNWDRVRRRPVLRTLALNRDLHIRLIHANYTPIVRYETL